MSDILEITRVSKLSEILNSALVFCNEQEKSSVSCLIDRCNEVIYRYNIEEMEAVNPTATEMGSFRATVLKLFRGYYIDSRHFNNIKIKRSKDHLLNGIKFDKDVVSAYVLLRRNVNGKRFTEQNDLQKALRQTINTRILQTINKHLHETNQQQIPSSLRFRPDEQAGQW